MKNPYRNYRRWMQSYSCEICGYHPKNPSLIEGHHLIPQSQIKKWKEELKNEKNEIKIERLKRKIKRGRRTIVSVCASCHALIEIGEIKTIQYKSSTSGRILEWCFTDFPDDLKYGVETF